jgi:hypothetical protein
MKLQNLFETEAPAKAKSLLDIPRFAVSIGQHLTSDFYCSFNELTSLEGGPSSVTGIFNCSNNDVTSLEGAPSSVTGNFYCGHNKLTSLKNIHKQIKFISGRFIATANLIESHVLGLLLINGITEVQLDNKEVHDILNSYLPSKGMESAIACQDELIEAGFEDFAQL